MVSKPDYHKIALNNAKVIEQYSTVLHKRNEYIKKLEAELKLLKEQDKGA